MTASETPAELKFVSMDDTTAPIDYGLEYLETGLASGQQGAGDRWQAAFEAARDGWDLVHAQQLLLLVKRLSLDLRRQSVVRYLEGTLMVRQGEWPAAVVAFERALANKRQVGDGAGEVAVLNALASLYRRMDKPLDEVAQLYEQALGLTENSSDDATRAGLQTGLGVTYYAQGKLDRARACQEEVLTLARNLGDRALEATALHHLGAIAWTRGELEQAMAQLEAALALAGNYRDCMASVHQVLGDLERLAPQPDASRILQHYTEALAYAADFNQSALDQILNYLQELWSAHAEDGYGDEVLWFCRSIVALWQEIGLAEEHPEVIEMFKKLAASATDD